MRYYPKSQVQPNLYTNGDEFFLINTQTPYTGYYYKLSTNKKYTGKTPDEGPGVELVPNTTLNGNPPDTFSTPTPDSIRTTKNLSDFDDSLAYYNNNVTLIYPNLKDFQSRTLPPPYFPRPTQKEKIIGEYRRYFAKKTNEYLYIEISKETYTKFTSNDPTVASDLYECLFLPWSIRAVSSLNFNSPTTETVNRKIVAQVERNNKWYGFTSYFRGNFG